MDWLRRNWVDVLMAGLILAVVGGFLTLLLRGGVFKPNTDATTTVATTTTPVTTVPAPTTPKPTPPNQLTPAPSSQPVAVKPAQKPAPTTPKPRSTTPLGVPEIPEAPIGAVVTKPVVTKLVVTTSGVGSTSGTTTPISNTTNSSITAPSRPAVQTQPSTSSKIVTPTNTTGTYARADFLRNYRVAAGSYTNLERAKKAVAQLRSRGLPAQTFPSGNTHVVVVGPYARETSARTAFAKVRQVFPDAILYRPDGTKEASARVNIAPKAPSSQGGGNSQPATLTTDSAYLQVGAFKDVKGAAALLTKLKNAGFAPLTKNISGLLRVLVGPLQANQIQTIRSDLKNQGFEAFQVNL
jgi:cell division septation protein DedD